jgi:hypothetical protein
VNRSLGFPGEDLDFLQEVGPKIVSLEVVGSFKSDAGVSQCTNLEELNLNTDCRGGIDWGSFKKLRYLFAYSDRLDDSICDLSSLEVLSLYGATDSDFSRVEGLGSLRELQLKSTKITSVPTGGWATLRVLSVERAPRLRDFSGIEAMGGLERLTLEQCKHLEDLQFLRGCPSLQHLNVSDSGRIHSLTPLGNCPELVEVLFYGSTDVADGDLSILGQLRHLERADYRARRNYRGAPARFPTID